MGNLGTLLRRLWLGKMRSTYQERMPRRELSLQHSKLVP